MTMSPGREANKRCMSLQDGLKQLLPGIPDEITLLKIVPKLPWKTFYSLSLVSCTWLQGIRARQVYDARVVSQSADTLLIVRCRLETEGSTTLAFYSKKDHSLTRLPPIPYEGDDCHWVSLDEKIYFLAGEGEYGPAICWRDARCSNKVFVLDKAAQGQWKECASMVEPRTHFGCSVMHGKIYVFGGLPIIESPNRSTICPPEVYDPEEDSCSLIRAMKLLRFGHRVEAVGDELFTLSGRFLDPVYFDCDDDSSDDDYALEEDYLTWLKRCGDVWKDVGKETLLEVYHPVKDEWRVENASDSNWECDHFLFVAHGKLYAMSLDWRPTIDLYDVKDNSWTGLHEFFYISLPGPADSEVSRQRIRAVVAVDDELVVRVSWWCKEKGVHETYVFESKGFCNESEEIVWQQSQFPSDMATFPNSSNRLIQL